MVPIPVHSSQVVPITIKGVHGPRTLRPKLGPSDVSPDRRDGRLYFWLSCSHNLKQSWQWMAWPLKAPCKTMFLYQSLPRGGELRFHGFASRGPATCHPVPPRHRAPPPRTPRRPRQRRRSRRRRGAGGWAASARKPSLAASLRAGGSRWYWMKN